MLILLSPAKTMAATSKAATPPLTTPRFLDDAHRFAAELSRWNAEDLSKALGCNAKIAAENHLRFANFLNPDEQLPAVLAYTGQAYRLLRARDFTQQDLAFAQDHLLLCSFLYGLLRPLDAIHPYRLEGKVRLDATDGQTMFEYWRPRLTQLLIDAVRADDGMLIHLATEEMEHLFDWSRVCHEVRVVQPLFFARQAASSPRLSVHAPLSSSPKSPRSTDLKVIAVHAKSCRGAMARHIITNRIASPEALLDFAHDGYIYQPATAPVNPSSSVEYANPSSSVESTLLFIKQL